MKRTPNFLALEGYARKQIDAHHHMGDYHCFTLARCAACGVVPFALTIEHHTGSRKGNFRGRIFGCCAECGEEMRIFSFSGKHRQAQRREKPACTCGNGWFYLGECERIERDDGLLGFFDEGVVVGQCSLCGRHKTMVQTD